MKKRYIFHSDQKKSSQAIIYNAQEIGIPKNHVDEDARNVIYRFKQNGYEAYIVGGAVRDLICDKIPKDFDIATNATPKQTKKIFRNARIIGKRFKLIHLFYSHSNKIIEVSTFRAKDKESNNVFGTLVEDVTRRDFSVNALFYDPTEEEVLDFVHGYEDLKNRRLRCVVPLRDTFSEDPVRMIRAIKYSSTLSLDIPMDIARKIKRDAKLLSAVSTSRVSEEINKIFTTSCSSTIISNLKRYHLFAILFPQIAQLCKKKPALFTSIINHLDTIDANNQKEKPKQQSKKNKVNVEPLACFLYPIIEELTVQQSFSDESEFYSSINQLKQILSPYIPPNERIENALRYYYSENDLLAPMTSYKQWKRLRKTSV